MVEENKSLQQAKRLDDMAAELEKQPEKTRDNVTIGRLREKAAKLRAGENVYVPAKSDEALAAPIPPTPIPVIEGAEGAEARIVELNKKLKTKLKVIENLQKSLATVVEEKGVLCNELVRSHELIEAALRKIKYLRAGYDCSDVGTPLQDISWENYGEPPTDPPEPVPPTVDELQRRAQESGGRPEVEEEAPPLPPAPPELPKARTPNQGGDIKLETIR